MDSKAAPDPSAEWPDYSLGGRMMHALAGVMAIGVLVPSLLIWCRTGNIGITRFEGSLSSSGNQPVKLEWNLSDMGALTLGAAFMCGPGALVACVYGMGRLRLMRAIQHGSERVAMAKGGRLGVFFAFLNLPAFFGAKFFRGEDEWWWLRFAALLAITGASCGAWVGWQAYKEWHTERGMFPAFTLQTLLVLVILYGFLVGLYFPR